MLGAGFVLSLGTAKADVLVLASPQIADYATLAIKMHAPISGAAPIASARTYRRRSRGPACRRAPNYNALGEFLGKIHIPETVANLCFGGMFRNRLYCSMPSTQARQAQ